MQRDTLTQEPYRSEVRPQQEEDTIDLLELCMGLLDHWKFIAAAAAAGAVLAALYTFLLVTPPLQGHLYHLCGEPGRLGAEPFGYPDRQCPDQRLH